MGNFKARFHTISEAATTRTTVVKVKTIQLIDQMEVYKLPTDKQTNVHHTKLFEHPVIKGVVKSLKERNKFRKVVITLTKGDGGKAGPGEEVREIKKLQEGRERRCGRGKERSEGVGKWRRQRENRWQEERQRTRAREKRTQWRNMLREEKKYGAGNYKK
ncbi:hypothetical protein KM043_017092 [Ampulex compressa]|nr:hypothetical protein KM043_017092 [Ampulex compressa]